ncbi:MAG: hypothetical protein NT076_02210 [Candidatus Pacearchaeota archaeon]|nr:hypothetical protein [Candidatus Pacearchaeota archaeon]
MQARDCIEVAHLSARGAFGGNITFRFHMNRALVDPFFFIKRLLEERDYTFNYWEQIKRVRESDDAPEIDLSLFDFAQAFFGAYAPNQMADYLAPLLIPSESSQGLLERVREFETHNKAAIVALQKSNTSNGQMKARLYPINIPLEEINQLIRLNVPKKYLPKDSRPNDNPWYFGRRKDIDCKNHQRLSIPFYFTWKGYRDRERRVKSPHHLVEALTCKEPRVILYHSTSGPNLTSDFSMLREFPEIGTGDLEVIRKSRD